MAGDSGPGPALARALTRDDAEEERTGSAAGRSTCWTCKTWADHAHDPLTGRRITLDEYEKRRTALGA